MPDKHKSQPTADDLWEWLRSCRTCGRAHTFHEWTDEGGAVRGSWADRENGHVFRPRMPGNDWAPLIVEWEKLDEE